MLPHPIPSKGDQPVVWGSPQAACLQGPVSLFYAHCVVTAFYTFPFWDRPWAGRFPGKFHLQLQDPGFFFYIKQFSREFEFLSTLASF